MKVRDQLLRSREVALTAATRLPVGYLLEAASPRTVCESCQAALRRQRSATRHPVGLMLGRPRVRLVQKQCPACGRVYPAQVYAQWVPPQGNYAFDLIVAVGLARFQGQRQNQEIQQELEQGWGLRLPGSTVSELAQTFLDCLAATHQAHLPELRRRLREDGGYALHVDGTCEAGTALVFTALAGNRGWTLAGAKLATEEAAGIAALLRRCVEAFGTPLALVRDLSPAIENARQQVMPDVPDLICQYHFLENVGSRLCEPPHVRLTAGLRRLKIRRSLHTLRHHLLATSREKGAPLSALQIAQLLRAPERAAQLDPAQGRRALAYLLLDWLEDYGADLSGQYFPFDLPSLAFYRRCHLLYELLVQILADLPDAAPSFSTLQTMRRHLASLEQDPDLSAAAARLEKAAALFNELRLTLRLSPQTPLTGPRLAPAEAPPQAQLREQDLGRWSALLQERTTTEQDPDRLADLQTVRSYLDKYQDKLSGHLIPLQDRPQPFVVQRTNNLCERRFGVTKQGLRRRVGARKLTRHVHALRPEQFLVANLDHPDYLDIICAGRLENLPAAFAQNWQAARTIRTERRKKTTCRPIPVSKKCLREDGFLSRIQLAVVTLSQPTNAEELVA